MIRSELLAFDEDQLVTQAQAGQLSAFGELISHHQDRLYGLAYQMTGSADDAAEAVQETFLRALKAIGQFQRKACFYTWLVRIMINLVNDFRERSHRESQRLARQADEMLRHSQAAAMIEQQDPGRPMQQKEMVELVHQAINLLEPALRQTLVLRELEQFSYRQIADAMNVSEGTVKSRLFRAREALRLKLAKYV